MKSLLDRFRKPEWQHADPVVRAEALLKGTAIDDAVLRNLAQSDPDARVRRAALKRIDDLGLLATLAEGDSDSGVREEATQKLVTVACHTRDEAHAKDAVKGLSSERHLASVARSAGSPVARAAALERLTDGKLLATVVREAEDSAARLEALARIDDAQLLAGFALKSEVKAIALAALERVNARADLEAIAAKARVGLVARRAASRLEAVAAASPATSAPISPSLAADDGDIAAYEAKRAEMEREAAARSAAAAKREAVCARLEEAARGEKARSVLAEARAAWEGLEPLTGVEGETLAKRFALAIAGAEHEASSFEAGEALRGTLEALVAEAEPLAEAEDLAAARTSFDALARRWNESRGGAAPPLDLRPRLDAVAERLAAREAESKAARAGAERSRLAQLTSLCNRAEALGRHASPPLRDAERALREVREALAAPGHLPTRKDRDDLVARLEALRHSLQPLIAQLREDAEWKRFANVDVQEDLAAKAEALGERTDFDKVILELRELEARWKQAKEAPREQGEALWVRFKAARDLAHQRCEEHFAREAEERKANLELKEALVRRAEELGQSTEWKKTAEALKQLQNEWKAVGAVPQAAAKAVWERFRKPCDEFFTRRDQNLATQRAEWEKNLAQKDALCVKAEALAESTDWEAASAEIRNLQTEWRKVGPVNQKVSDAIWGRFRRASDLFFERYRRRDDLAAQAALAAREALVAEAQALAGSEESTLAERTAALLGSWKQAPVVPADRSAALSESFGAAVAKVLESNSAAFAGTDLDPELALRKAEKLVARVEAALVTGEGEQAPPATTADLASRLRDALATNTIAGRDAVDDRWRMAAAEVEAADGAWQKLGPLVGEAGREMAARYLAAIQAFQAKRPAPPRVAEGASRREPRPRGGERDGRGRGDRSGRDNPGGRNDRRGPGGGRPPQANRGA